MKRADRLITLLNSIARSARAPRRRCAISVRKAPLETATLAILQEHLLTDDHARLFAEEFERETRRLGQRERCNQNAAEQRMKQFETELANLYQNLLAGLARPALHSMIADREAEKARLESSGGAPAARGRAATAVLPSHAGLRKQFRREGGGSASIAR